MKLEEITIRALQKIDLTMVKEFADKWIGQDYYLLVELEDIFELSHQNNMNASFLAFYEERLIGIRLSFAPGSWLSKFSRGLTPNLWNASPFDVGYFKSLFVEEEFQQLGLGKKLSNHSLEIFKKMNAKAVLCHSWLESPGNSSQLYLTKMGFKEVCRHEEFWGPIDYECTRCTPSRCECCAVEMIKHLD